MFLLESFLKPYLKDKKAITSLLKNNLQQIDTELLIEIIKILNDELKIRIEEFENKEDR
jgi:hypothetical protein